MNKKALNYLLNLDLLIAGISLIVLIAVTFTGVLMRYLFNNPFVWQEEVQLWCFVWLVFFGTGAAFRSGSHVAIDVLVDRMPPALKRIAEVFGYLVTMAVLLFLMTYGIKLVQQLYYTNRLTNVLKVPYSIIYAALPIGCMVMIINFTIVIFGTLGLIKVEMESGE